MNNDKIFYGDDVIGALPGHVQRVASRVIDTFGDDQTLCSFMIEMSKSERTRSMVEDVLTIQRSLEAINRECDRIAETRNNMIRALLGEGTRVRVERAALRHQKKVKMLERDANRSQDRKPIMDDIAAGEPSNVLPKIADERSRIEAEEFDEQVEQAATA